MKFKGRWCCTYKTHVIECVYLIHWCGQGCKITFNNQADHGIVRDMSLHASKEGISTLRKPLSSAYCKSGGKMIIPGGVQIVHINSFASKIIRRATPEATLQFWGNLKFYVAFSWTSFLLNSACAFLIVEDHAYKGRVYVTISSFSPKLSFYRTPHHYKQLS